MNRHMNRTYKYRICPTKAQVRALERQLDAACDLYNAALEQRRWAWKWNRVSIYYSDQQRDLTQVRGAGLLPEGMNAQSQQHVLKRVDRAFEAFKRRSKQKGQKPGYPRFRSRDRYSSLTWSCGPGGNGCRIKNDLLSVQGIGAIRVRWHRELVGQLKETTIKRSAGKWYVCFSLVVPLPEPLPKNNKKVGIDLGITDFAALSDGEMMGGPRAYRKAERELHVAQRRVSRRKPGSKRRKKAALILARKHEHIHNIRRNHAFQIAHELVQRFDFISVEGLEMEGLTQGYRAKDVHDQGWSQFRNILRDKAEEAGRTVVLVDPAYTSQRCYECGHIAKESRKGDKFKCVNCGHKDHAGTNAAKNILRLGRSLQGVSSENQCH